LDLRGLAGRLSSYFKVERSVAVLSLTAVAGVFGNSLWALYIPLILSERGVGVYLQGVLYTIVGISTIALQVPLGVFVDSFGYKRSLIVGNALISAAPLVLALSRDPITSSAAVYIFHALGQPISALSWRSYVMEISRERAAVGLGLYYSVTGLAASAGTLVGGVAASVFTFTNVLLLSSALALLTTISRLAFLEELPRGGIRAGAGIPRIGVLSSYLEGFRASVSLYRSNPAVRALIAVAPINASAVLSPGSYVVTIYLSEVVGMGAQEIAPVFFLRTVVENQAALLLGAVAHRLGPRASIALSWALSSALQMVLALRPSREVASTAYIAWVALLKLSEISTVSLLAGSVESGKKASAQGSIGAISGVASLPAPIIQSVAYTWDPRIPFTLSASASALSAAILVAILGRRIPRKG